MRGLYHMRAENRAERENFEAQALKRRVRLYADSNKLPRSLKVRSAVAKERARGMSAVNAFNTTTRTEN